ncbi:Transcriptional regulator hosA [Salmonella enterica subsp. enterica]|uniref:Transcriptional regulator hosA n=1 Tax=Salmonella enterica I TaxID=59201 RepID=A0A379WN67_SALET|nr:Transcriptional regulator hosA [Salmonella enterica subsp. enterica]
MELRNTAFHLLRQLFQQHTARWQHELPELTKTSICGDARYC